MIMFNNVSVSLLNGGITERIKGILNLKSSSRVLALKDITLWIGNGESWGLIGENTVETKTFLRTIAGALLPSFGQVKSDGKIACAFFEENNLILTDTGEQNCVLCAKLKGLCEAETKLYVNSVFEQSMLYDYFKMPVRKYSNDMRSRLLMSMALCAKPDILLIDNALEHCGLPHAQRYISLINAQCKLGMTVITKSSSNEVLGRVAGGAIWLKNGSLYKLGDFDTLNKDYLTPKIHGKDFIKERAVKWLNAQNAAFSSELSLKLPSTNKKYEIQDRPASEQVIKLREILCEYIKANAEFSRQNTMLLSILKNERKRASDAEQKLKETIISSNETLKLVHKYCSESGTNIDND